MERAEHLGELQKRLSAESFDALQADFTRAEREGRSTRWLDRLTQAADRLPLAEPPPALRQQLRDLFDPPLRSEGPAVMVFDSRADLALAGVRGADDDVGWSAIFTSDAADVAIDVWPVGDGTFDVDGHVMAHAGTSQGWRVRLELTGADWDDADDLGRFGLQGLATGVHDLVIESTRNRMIVQLELTESE